MKKILILIFMMLLLDQSIKIFIKTNFEIGESVKVFPWFFISFIENPGMAYGLHLDSGYIGKIALSSLRFFLVIFIFLCIYRCHKAGVSNYFIIPMSIIFSGAVGNLIDSIFYGLIFDRGIVFNEQNNCWISYEGIARFSFPGYSFFMGGSVVDMFFFPIIDFHWPEWVPYIGGKRFEFFKPVFNLSDFFIFIGGTLIIIFSNNIFNKVNMLKKH